MHYKACAAYCTKAMSDPNNIRYYGDGTPHWTIEKLAVLDHGLELIWLDTHGGKVFYDREVLYGPTEVGSVMYIVTAMMNAIHDVKSEANREMTPTEIAKEFGLGASTVRKYIHDHEDDLVALGVIRKADKRTWLCKRGWAINVWVQRLR
jgi:hypothetical protein